MYLDPFAEAEMIEKEVNIRDICLRNFIISTIILQRGALAGLTLFDIGTILYREEED